jgi:MFS family permease
MTRIKTGRLPSEHEDETVLSLKVIVALLIITIFLTIYFVDKEVNKWINLQIQFILNDWQLLFSILSILGLTIGWWLLQGLSMGILYLSIGLRRRLTSNSAHYVRYGLTTFFLSSIFTNYLFGYTFDDFKLWTISLLFTFSITLFVLAFIKFKQYIDEKRGKTSKQSDQRLKEKYKGQLIPKEEKKVIEPKWYWIALLLAIVPIIIFYIYNTFGITDITLKFFDIVNSSIILKVNFALILIFTIFWKPVVWIFGYLLPKIAEKLITVVARRRINRLRIFTVILVVSMLLIKNLPFMEFLTPFERELWSSILGAVVAVGSSYVTRRLFIGGGAEGGAIF